MKKLNRNTSDGISKRPVKVLQFGKGNFLRGFVDWMIDILNEKTDFDGDVQIVESIDNGLAAKIEEQEGLYHVVLEGLQCAKKIRETRLITCVRGVINPKKNYKTFLKLGKNPHLQCIISNTTEAGIVFDPEDTSFETLPNSFPGKLTALLYYRFLHYKGSNNDKIIILPCELILQNGERLEEIVLQYAKLWDLPEGFAYWLKKNIIFCNTLVDRIVTGFPKDTSTQIQKEIGYEDNLIVKAELFHLWVIEKFDSLREMFPLDDAALNIKFVKNLSPYRTRKVSILNGAHTAMVPLGILHGIDTVKEVLENPKTFTLITQIIFDEIIPTLDLPEAELIPFANTVIERFKNPFINHKLASISLNSISKFRVRVLPSLLSYFEIKGKLPPGLVTSFAHLMVLYRGYLNDKIFSLKDDPYVIEFFNEVWNSEDIENIVQQILSNTKLWETDLNTVTGLQAQLSQDIDKILATEN